MQYINTYNSKNLKMVVGKSQMCLDEMKEYIWRLERRALQLFPTLSAFCKYSQLERKIFCRLRDRGLYSINYLTLLRLCYGLKLTPNKIMRFEDWDDIPLQTVEINYEALEKTRISWREQMNVWASTKKQKPKTNKRYGIANF